MAQIDLKNVTIKMQDGYAGPGGTPKVNHKLADPVSGPSVDPVGGGSMGGLLTAGTYHVSFTYVTVDGETLRSGDTTFTSASGNIPELTFPALPAGAVSRNVYLSTTGGGTGTETKYNVSPVTTLTYDLTTDVVAGAAPPSVSTAGLLYAIGTVTMLVTGFAGAVVTGDSFTVAGDPSTGFKTVYKISAHSETLGNTTSVTFGPALDKAADDQVALTIQPHSIAVKIGEGNLTYSEKRKIKYVTDRGLLDTVRLDDQEPVEVKLDFTWSFLRGDTSDPVTPEEAIKQTGNASAWVSSAADKCEPYSVDLVLTNIPPCAGVKAEVITLPYFRYEDLGHDPKTAQLAVTGKCNVIAALVARV